MNGLMFVLKNFLMTLFLVYLMQFKVGGISLETRFDQWLRNSEISQQVRLTASGATLFIEESAWQIRNKAQSLWNTQVNSKSEKASK
ncbi:MAG: hypothetical protein AABY64_01890 [Bdellovibrionota bacterium]